MIFNITILFQMCHFGIAYLLLRYLFFIPILKFLDKQKTYQAKREAAIIELEEAIVTIKKQQRKELEIVKAHFISHQPNLAELVQSVGLEQVLASPIDNGQERYLFSKKLKQFFQQKLHG